MLAAALFAGCGSKTTTEPLIVKLPQQSLGQFKAGNVAERCQFEDIDLSVFNQKAQRLKFSGAICDDLDLFRVEEGHKVIFEFNFEDTKQTGSYLVMTLHKLGPLTEMAFMKTLIPVEGHSNSDCIISEVEPHVWSITTPEGWETVIKDCGEYADFPGWAFVFSKGIVFGISARHTGIDLATLTYENSG